MSKTSVFTTITPLPSGITRQSVIETYHNHAEMISLNPMVIEKYECQPPKFAPREELQATWWTIKDKVPYFPRSRAATSVSYLACLYNLPSGLQTHVYAPFGLHIWAKWSIGGSLPGEDPSPTELGINAPRKGLYIREDVRMRCNILMSGFVKKTFQDCHKKLVELLMDKAHALDAEAANSKLERMKELRASHKSIHGSIYIAPPPGYKEEMQMIGKTRHDSHGSTERFSIQVPSPRSSQASTITSNSNLHLMPPFHADSLMDPLHKHSRSLDSWQDRDYKRLSIDTDLANNPRRRSAIPVPIPKPLQISKANVSPLQKQLPTPPESSQTPQGVGAKVSPSTLYERRRESRLLINGAPRPDSPVLPSPAPPVPPKEDFLTVVLAH